MVISDEHAASECGLQARIRRVRGTRGAQRSHGKRPGCAFMFWPNESASAGISDPVTLARVHEGSEAISG